MNYRIKPSTLSGEITIPPSKSHTLRAIFFASLAQGESHVHHPLDSPDTKAMVEACRHLGARIKRNNGKMFIAGVAGKPHVPSITIDAGNSGIVLRFITAIAALSTEKIIITGDHSICSNRPILPLLQALDQLQVTTTSLRGNGYAPVMIKGPLEPGVVHIDGEDSQPVSALLIATAFASGKTTIHVTHPGERPWIDLTLSWFDRLGIQYCRSGYDQYEILGPNLYKNFEYYVPGDFSSAAFALAAALITRAELTLKNLDLNDPQGDKVILSMLEKMGASFLFDSEEKSVHVKKIDRLQGMDLNLNDCIDALPILAVLGCYAQGETCLRGVAIARKKESDRLSAITQELRTMGASIIEKNDELLIQGAPLHPAMVDSHHDHRIAMSLAVAAMGIPGESMIRNVDCVSKSYPHFSEDFEKIGAAITVSP